MTERKESTTGVTLSERELSALRFAVMVVRGVEGEWSTRSGAREGEAMSDALSTLVARAELPRRPRKYGYRWLRGFTGWRRRKCARLILTDRLRGRA